LPISHGFFSAGHIQTEGIAIDVFERLLRRNICAARFQRGHQLDLMVIVLGQRRIGMIRDRADRDVLDGVGRFLKKERRLAGRIGATLDGVRGIVASDAIDPAHGKHVGLADDRDRGHRHRENRLRTGLRLGAATLRRGAGQCQRAGCKKRPAIDGIHERSPVLPVSVIHFAGGF
jgi:hypothetical protein